MLLRHCDAQRPVNIRNINYYRRFSRTGCCLHLRLETVKVINACHLSIIRHTNQNHPAGSIGKSTDLTTKIRRTRPLELGCET